MEPEALEAAAAVAAAVRAQEDEEMGVHDYREPAVQAAPRGRGRPRKARPEEDAGKGGR